MKLQNTPTGKGLAAIYRQEIIQNVTLFISQRVANFYDKLFSCLDFTLPRAATGRRGFPKESMLCACPVMKCVGFGYSADLMDYLEDNRIIFPPGLVFIRIFSLDACSNLLAYFTLPI